MAEEATNGETSNLVNGAGGAISNGMIGSKVNGVEHKNIIDDSTFDGNTASYVGGAIYNQGNLTISGTTTFTANTALKGGAIYTDANVLTLSATEVSDVITFSGNVATEENGGTDLFIGKHKSVTGTDDWKMPVVNLTGNGSIIFGGSIAGVSDAVIASDAAIVNIADASGYLGRAIS